MVGPVGWRFNFNWGWRSKIVYVEGPRLFRLTVEDYLGWWLKIIEVDGSSRGHVLRTFVDRLSSIYEACHVSVFDWILYRIEASLHLPCISHIYSTLLLPHFNIFQPKHIVRTPSSTLSEHSVEHLYPSIIQPSTFHYSERWVFIIIFSKSCILCLHFARPTHPSTLLDPSVLGFVVNCRQCLVR